MRLTDGYEIQEAIEEAYQFRERKKPPYWSVQIRGQISTMKTSGNAFFFEHELSVGDFLMVVKNNYFWLKPLSEAGFIANGDIVEVLEIFAFKDLYGFKFAEVKVRMTDYPNQPPFETVLLLDTLTAQTPSLSYEDGNKLYQEVMKDYAKESSKYKKFLAVKNNTFFNALQVKFSYAITCHKSQGGQWHSVFVASGFEDRAPGEVHAASSSTGTN